MTPRGLPYDDTRRRLVHMPLRVRGFELVRTLELDLDLGDDAFAVRVELLSDLATPTRFRARLWRLERHHLQPSFPSKDGRPTGPTTDEIILREWSPPDVDLAAFEAPDPTAAVNHVLAHLGPWLESQAL